jgi:hypothetical protein
MTEDLCASAAGAFDLVELLPILGPVGAILAVIIGLEAYLNRRKKRGGTQIHWEQPVAPSSDDVSRHEEASAALVERAEEIGPHKKKGPVAGGATDEEIDGWARGE